MDRTPELTIRERVNKKVRVRTWGFLLSPFLALLAVTGGFALTISLGMPDAAILGVSLGAGLVVFVVCGAPGLEPWLCPTCKRKMLPYCMVGGYKGNLFEMPKKFRFCPYCGQNFDEPMPEKE